MAKDEAYQQAEQKIGQTLQSGANAHVRAEQCSAPTPARKGNSHGKR
jgi:hypothetical protein